MAKRVWNQIEAPAASGCQACAMQIPSFFCDSRCDGEGKLSKKRRNLAPHEPSHAPGDWWSAMQQQSYISQEPDILPMSRIAPGSSINTYTSPNFESFPTNPYLGLDDGPAFFPFAYFPESVPIQYGFPADDLYQNTDFFLDTPLESTQSTTEPSSGSPACCFDSELWSGPSIEPITQPYDDLTPSPGAKMDEGETTRVRSIKEGLVHLQHQFQVHTKQQLRRLDKG